LIIKAAEAQFQIHVFTSEENLHLGLLHENILVREGSAAELSRRALLPSLEVLPSKDDPGDEDSDLDSLDEE
jgi:hypothetical protein